MARNIVLISIAVVSLLLTACSHQQNLDSIDTANLSQLEQVRVYPRTPSLSKVELSQLRAKQLKDSSMSVGAQGGLAWASTQINEQMNKDGKYLESIFNFNGMVLSHGVMPPVLEQSNNNLNLADPNTIRVADRSYRIVKQAQFATTPPNWREYLWLNFDKPQLPDRSLLPRTNAEHKIWQQGIRMGWSKGIQQAYSIFQQNLARLKRDYKGMALYRKLLQEKMISPPFVSRTELGVTGDGTDMRINDQVLRIVELPKLQTNSKTWRAVVVKNNE